MASATSPGYDLSVRQALRGKGVSDSDIGYNKATGYVTVGGQNFLKPAKAYSGTSFTDQNSFNSAWNDYQKAKTQPMTTATPSYTPATTATPTVLQYNPYNTNNPYDSQYSELLSSLLNQARNPTPVSVSDIYNSPQYAAQQAQAQRQAQQGIRAAQEAMGASGFGRSTALAERAQGIQNDANAYLETQVLPQLMSQAQNERQQQLQNQLTLLNQLQSAQGVYDNRYNNAQDLALQKGQLTGSYLDPSVSSLIGQILQEKQNYGSAQDATSRQQANVNANALRSQLAALGVDPSLFGANQTLAQAQANMSRAGTQTLAARNQQFDQDVTMAELTGRLPDGTPTNAYQQQQLANLWTVAEQTGVIPNELADMYGIPRGTQTQAAKQFALNYALDEQRTNASIANQEAQTALDYQRYNDSLWNPQGATSTSGLTPNQAYDAIRSQYLVTDPDTKKSYITKNKDERKNMIAQIIALGMPDAQTDQLAAALGITSKEWQDVTGVPLGE
ncbi:hypothetical protein H7B90_23515 [Cohnella xylanilytica]|uniref:Uncharacterized protein n=1 Tax=Cohnella xylanilytica TaxID=557555 RepID=A0A841U3M8_9BACL|nr:hypothetical protein [Cohnella xylanilytica]MBB6694369.1 hypothetical protein [Cohnella xylanilytica]